MFLKFFPEDVPLDVLVRQNFFMLQSTFIRIKELQADGTASLSDDNRRALQELIELLEQAHADAMVLQNKLVN